MVKCGELSEKRRPISRRKEAGLETLEFYHASRKELQIGTVLEGRFHTGFEESNIHLAMMSALDEDPLVVKGLLLADIVVMAMRGENQQMAGTLLEAVYEMVRSQSFPGILGKMNFAPTLERGPVRRCSVLRLYRGRIERGRKADT